MAKILCIDDDSITLSVVEKLLSKDGHEVHTRRKPSEGLAYAKGWRPDLILLDIMMPEEDGGVVLEKIRKDDVLSKTKVVILSSQEKVEVIRPLLMRGADGYCAKVRALESLSETVKTVLAGRKEVIWADPSLLDAARASGPPIDYVQQGRAGILTVHGDLGDTFEQRLIAQVDLSQALSRDLIIDIRETTGVTRRGASVVSKILQGSRSRRCHAVIVATGDQEFELRDAGLDIAADIFYEVEDAHRFLR